MSEGKSWEIPVKPSLMSELFCAKMGACRENSMISFHSAMPLPLTAVCGDGGGGGV